MIDPRRYAILVRAKTSNTWDNQTDKVVDCEPIGTKVRLTYRNRSYDYGADRVAILTCTGMVTLNTATLLEVSGRIQTHATTVSIFDYQEHKQAHVFYASGDFKAFPLHETRILQNTVGQGTARDVLDYFCRVVNNLPKDDPTRHGWRALDSIHPDSVLAQYLSSTPIKRHNPTCRAIFPFDSNLSQSQAIHNALTSSLSVIDGPPGTGKTQTILNLVASLLTDPTVSIGIVSSNNSAVDNVCEKLASEGFGHVIANLGKKEKQTAFFSGQGARNEALVRLQQNTEPSLSVDTLDRMEKRIREAWRSQRQLKELEQEAADVGLEYQHLTALLEHQQVATLATHYTQALYLVISHCSIRRSTPPDPSARTLPLSSRHHRLLQPRVLRQ